MIARTTRWLAVPWVSAVTFWLHLGVAGFALSRCFAGHGQPRIWLAVATVLPISRLIVDRGWRQRQFDHARSVWRTAEQTDGNEWEKWLAGAVFAAAPAVFLYCLPPFYQIDSGDTWAVIPTAASLVREGNTEVSEFVAVAPPEYLHPHPDYQGLPYGVMSTRVGVHSRYPVGMTAFAVPVALLARLSGADFADRRVIAALDRWAAVLVAAGVLVLFFRLALCLGPPAAALAATLLMGCASTVYTTVAQTLWQHGGVMLGLMVLLLVELHPRLRKSRWGAPLFGTAAGMMFACRLTAVPTVAVVWVWVFLRNPRRGLLFAASSAAGVFPWAWFYLAVYGTTFGPSAAQAAGSNWTTDVGPAVAGLLVSPGRGLLVYQPWVLLVVAGLFLPRDPATPAGWRTILWAIAGVHLGLVSAWGYWTGGSCWGSRLLSEMLVSLGLLAVPLLAQLIRRWGIGVFAILLAVCMVPHLAGAFAFRLSANWKGDDARTMWAAPNWSGLSW